ncbi:MAG: helix-turn-helix domain-containing protein [Pyrinomonadaceae bacterium]
MSSGKLKKVENSDFIKRFVEVCGSSQPVEVARLLNISYQAAKNYLFGRMPDSNVLVIISERTPYSIHWLLTGQGKKFVESSQSEDTLRPSDQLREFVRRECLELIEEVLSRQTEAAQSKVVVLTSENIKKEKVMDETITFSGKQQ